MTRQVSVSVGVALAVVLSVLAASAPPVGAANTSIQAGDGLVVGSEHSSTSDFSSAQTMENFGIESGQLVLDTAGNKPSVSDGFEDGDASGWSIYGSGTNSISAVTSPVHNGSYAANVDSVHGDESGIVALDQADIGNYDGTINASLWMQETRSRPWLKFYDTSTGAHYSVQVTEVDGGRLFVNQYGSDGSRELQNFDLDIGLSADTWFKIEFSLNTETGEYHARLSNTSGGTVSVLEGKDATIINQDGFEPDAVGVTSYIGDEDFYIDDVQVSYPEPTDTYVSQTHTVENADAARVDFSELSDAEATITVQDGNGNQVGQTTVSSSGTHDIPISGATSSDYRTTISVARNGTNPSVVVDDESILFTNHQPKASNLAPADGTDASQSNVEFTADISDPEFSTAQGDEVTAELFVDGESVGSETVTSNQTVTVSHDLSEGGDHSYYWELTDSYGSGVDTTTSTRTVSTPSTLYIRDVTNSSKLVDGDNATVTFYGGDEEREIIERPASDSTISLEGLPTDTEFTVVVRADDYYTRQTIIPSLYEQSNIWMLPRNDTDAVEIVFLLDDRTGEFANSDSTQLRVQRAIEHNNSTQWRDVVGDDISATAELATTLENRQRYRLVISNEVQTRILGSYTPSGPADPETIPIGRIEFSGTANQGTVFDAALLNETQPAIRSMFRDPSNTAESLTYRITNTTGENESIVVSNTTVDSPNAFTSVTEPLPSNVTLDGSSYRVDLWTYQNGELVEHRSENVGQLRAPGENWLNAVNSGILTLTGYVFLVGAGYGTANYDPRLGSLVAVVFGAALTMFGVLSIPHVILGFTGTIALITNASART